MKTNITFLHRQLYYELFYFTILLVTWKILSLAKFIYNVSQTELQTNWKVIKIKEAPLLEDHQLNTQTITWK